MSVTLFIGSLFGVELSVALRGEEVTEGLVTEELTAVVFAGGGMLLVELVAV
jgi:hypothetical protein